MEKNVLLIAGTVLVVVIFVVSGSIMLILQPENMGEDDLRTFKGIPWASIPAGCEEFREDVCGMFECTVEACWCDDARADSAILFECTQTVQNAEEAIAVVKEYLNWDPNQTGSFDKAVKLNNIFYNVFFTTCEGEERVYTVAADGTIIKTVCGV
jgi:hypothetical protein